MSIFSSIISKIFGHASTPAVAAPAATPESPVATGTDAAAASVPPSSSPVPVPAEPVDVVAVLTALAAQKGGASDWKHSIVDLLKLLDLDSSLTARKELADELNVHAGEPGTAEQNLALQKAVLTKLADNGGKVPDELKN